MPADHDLDPDAMTESERLAKRRYEAYFAFETSPVGHVSKELLRGKVHGNYNTQGEADAIRE